MYLNISVKNRIAILKLFGYLSAETSCDFKKEVYQHTGDFDILIFDMEEVSYLNSTCIGAMLELKHNMKVEILLVVSKENEALSYVIETVNLKEIIMTFENIDEALAYVAKNYKKSLIEDELNTFE